jgi:uncharacterized protein with PhoU and TrkA domain
MAGILQVVQDIEKIGNAAYDIAKIVVKKLGIPPELLQDLPEAEEITVRVRIESESTLDGRSLEELDLPVETGMRPIAVRSGLDWNFDPDPEDVLREGDVLFLQGPPEGVAEVRRLAGAPVAVAESSAGSTDASPRDSEGLSEIERAVDILIEMKNLSEVAVGLAYSALLYYDAGLAREVVAIEDEMDEMRYRLERWVLLAAGHVEDPPRLRGVLHLATASEAIADCAMEMVWMVEEGRGGPPGSLGSRRRVRRDCPEADRRARLAGRWPHAGFPAPGDRDRNVRLSVQPRRSLDLPPSRLLHPEGGRLDPRDRRPRGARTLAELFGQELEELGE